jgi:hypothetical protein
LSEKAKSNLGAPSKLSAKPRIPHRINFSNQSQPSNTFSIQQRKIKQVRNKRRQENNSFNIISAGK